MATSTAGARSRLRLESGPAVDTNVTRNEGGERTTDGLVRLVAELEGASRAAPGTAITGRYQGGGKHFNREQEEDVLLQRLDLAVSQRLGAKSRSSIRADVYLRDRSTRDAQLPRDYLRIGAGLGPTFRPGAWRLTLRGFAERFFFKPDETQSADGFGGQALASRPIGPVTVSLTAVALRRTFKGVALRRTGGIIGGPPVIGQTDFDRVDQYGSAGMALQYVGGWFGRVGYTFELNDSNSYGGAFQRHRVNTSATFSLPLGLLASVSVGLQAVRYQDPLFISDVGQLDEEGRSALAARLERTITGPWALVLNAGAWFSPFGSGPDFSRQVLGLGLAYRRER